jgi:hypothetical protein
VINFIHHVVQAAFVDSGYLVRAEAGANDVRNIWRARHQWLTPVILAIRRFTVRSQPWANSLGEILSQKCTIQNKAGGVAQVVEHLPSKCESLSSNSNTAKKRKKIWTNPPVTRFALPIFNDASLGGREGTLCLNPEQEPHTDLLKQCWCCCRFCIVLNEPGPGPSGQNPPVFSKP